VFMLILEAAFLVQLKLLLQVKQAAQLWKIEL
jgi:hypothetical protein